MLILIKNQMFDTVLNEPPKTQPEQSGRQKLSREAKARLDAAERSLDAEEKEFKEQATLFELDEDWKKAWEGMPEFVQKDLTPIKTIYVHFEKWEDLDAFSNLVGQKLTELTRSIWYPEAQIGRIANIRYKAEAKLSDDELKEYKAMCINCELAGNDGADVYDIQEWCKSMEQKYGKPFNELV